MKPIYIVPFMLLGGLGSLVLANVGTQGVVDPIRRCGGYGTFRQLRISNCTGNCTFIAGRPSDCELDFMPSSSAPSLSLRIDVCHLGFCYNILEAILPNSSVQPGFVYTTKYTIVPNDVFDGQTITVQGYIYQTQNLRLEICVEFDADIVGPTPMHF